MSNSRKAEVIRRFRERVERDDLDGVDVTYRVCGGMPAEGRVDEELRLSGHASAAEAEDRSTALAAPRKASSPVERNELGNLLRNLGPELDSLVTRAEARFLPDSVVGSITIAVDGEEETLFFLADEEESQVQDESLPQETSKGIRALSQLSRRLLPKEEA
jgi:hypothetical protein